MPAPNGSPPILMGCSMLLKYSGAVPWTNGKTAKHTKEGELEVPSWRLCQVTCCWPQCKYFLDYFWWYIYPNYWIWLRTDRHVAIVYCKFDWNHLRSMWLINLHLQFEVDRIWWKLKYKHHNIYKINFGKKNQRYLKIFLITVLIWESHN